MEQMAYELRAWKLDRADSLIVERLEHLEAAHARQRSLRAQGYFSWVYDREGKRNVSCWLKQPRPI